MKNKLIKKLKNPQVLLLVWICIFAILRILPHPANVSPVLTLSVFAGFYLSWRTAIAAILLILIFSDLGLACVYHYPLFGYWSLFVYSGFLMIVTMGHYLRQHSKNIFLIYGIAISSSLGYWLWTNLGVWLFDAIYPKDMLGLMACYVAALPFLKHAILGDLFFTSLVFLSYFQVKKIFYYRKLSTLSSRAQSRDL